MDDPLCGPPTTAADGGHTWMTSMADWCMSGTSDIMIFHYLRGKWYSPGSTEVDNTFKVNKSWYSPGTTEVDNTFKVNKSLK